MPIKLKAAAAPSSKSPAYAMDSFQVIGHIFSQSSTMTAISNYSLAFSDQAITYASIVSDQATMYASIVSDQATAISNQATEYAIAMRPVMQSYTIAFLAAMVQATEAMQSAKQTTITTLTPYVNTFFDRLYDTSLRAQMNTALFLQRNPDTLAIVLATTIVTSILYTLLTPVPISQDERPKQTSNTLPVLPLHSKAE
jgi:hypothetical protein